MVARSNASASESRPVLQARALVKRYGAQVVVDGVDLKVYEGECFGLLGPNGAGKTTTLRMVLGLTPPTAGELEVLGLPIPRQSRQLHRHAGVVPQHDNLDPDFTVSENLVTYGSYFGLSRQVLRERMESLLRPMTRYLAFRLFVVLEKSGSVKESVNLER